MVFVYAYIKFIIIGVNRECFIFGCPGWLVQFSGSLRVNDPFLGALRPSKSGLINKHTVKHTVPVSVEVRTDTRTYRETYRDAG
jgi:hypothetical protein